MSNHPPPPPVSASESLKQNEMYFFGSPATSQHPSEHTVGGVAPQTSPQTPMRPKASMRAPTSTRPPDQAVKPPSIYEDPNFTPPQFGKASGNADSTPQKADPTPQKADPTPQKADATPGNADHNLRDEIVNLKCSLAAAQARLKWAEAGQEPGTERDGKIIEECHRNLAEQAETIKERDSLLRLANKVIQDNDAEIYRVKEKLVSDKKELRKKHQQTVLNVNREKSKQINALKMRYENEIKDARAASQENKKALARLSKAEAQLVEAKQEILDLCAAKAATEKELHDYKNRVEALAAFERGYWQVQEEHTELQAKYNDLQAENTELMEAKRRAAAEEANLAHQTQALSIGGPQDTRGSDQKAHIDILEAHWKNVLDSQMATIEKKQTEIALFEAKIASLQQPKAMK
ncbi:hypothetical protein IQ07DRAFT_602842 [Pyrenochaeta sp. DS3sAY3a]|nr:hypothetical protein IQ07DRAFT_602842 [Pyrenochaeta sp. DS3sAY3a]